MTWTFAISTINVLVGHSLIVCVAWVQYEGCIFLSPYTWWIVHIFDTAHYVCILNRCLYGLPDCQCYLNRATQPKLITSYTREFFFTSRFLPHCTYISFSYQQNAAWVVVICTHMHIWSYGHPVQSHAASICCVIKHV